jgi:WD40 repeat protein
LIGGSDGVPKLYKMYREKARVIGDDFNFIRQYEPMPGRIFATDFNADGSLLAAASSDGAQGEVRVYQTDDAKLVCKCEGQSGPVYACALTPDGKVVASGGFDGIVRLNDAQTGKLTREFAPIAASGAKVAAAE